MENNNATKEEVESFLREFKERARFFRIIFVDSKPNNIDTLTTLDITHKERENYVLSLHAEDYSQGPDKNDYPGQSDVWVFGKQVKGQEVYIKIFINAIPNQPNVCISFHIAKHKLTYPLKPKEDKR